MGEPNADEFTRLRLPIRPQPDLTTCGPTCLHAVYRYFDDPISLEQVIREIPQLKEGGTMAGVLGCHALQRGYEATIYTYDLQVFDPTWFDKPSERIQAKLLRQQTAKKSPKLQTATESYLEFCANGGQIRFHDLTSELIRRYLKRSIPILTGLSATYLYQESRERVVDGQADDIAGEPSGHFVVLCGYDRQQREVIVADPLSPNPVAAEQQFYRVGIDRVKCAILLGIMTYDANLLIVRPNEKRVRTQGGVSVEVTHR